MTYLPQYTSPEVANDMADIADLLENVLVSLKGSIAFSISETAKKHRFYGTSKNLSPIERAAYDRKYAVFWIIEKALLDGHFRLAGDLVKILERVQETYPERIAGEKDAEKSLLSLQEGHAEACLAVSRIHQEEVKNQDYSDPAMRPIPWMPYPLMADLPKIEPDFDAILTIVPLVARWKKEDMIPENVALLRKRMRAHAIDYMLLRDGSEKCARRESLDNSKAPYQMIMGTQSPKEDFLAESHTPPIPMLNIDLENHDATTIFNASSKRREALQKDRS